MRVGRWLKKTRDFRKQKRIRMLARPVQQTKPGPAPMSVTEVTGEGTGRRQYSYSQMLNIVS